MKVLFVSNDPAIFDATSAARERMRAYARAIGLSAAGQAGELHIVSAAPLGAQEEQEGDLFLHPVHASKLFRVRALASRAHELVLEKGVEVVSAQDPFEQGLAALRAIAGTDAKLHIQVHTDFLSPWFVRGGIRLSLLNRYRRRLADQVLPQAAGIRVVSQRIGASLVRRYGSTILEPAVIPVVVDAAALAPVPLPDHPFKFSLIAVGRLEREKRIEDILAALKLATKQYPTIGLFVVGTGSERARLGRLVFFLGLEKQVVFLGDRPDARGLMASAQAFIQASAYEGYGRTLIEAALARVPIITTDVGIVGDVIRHDEDALVVPVAKPLALSHAIAELVENNSLRQSLPAHAETVVRTHLAAVGDLPARIAEDLAATLRRI